MNNWKQATICANVSQEVYKDISDCKEALKEITKSSFKFYDNKGAQGCSFRYDKETVIFGFRGTQPDKFNDLLADIKAWRNDSETQGEVHAGFKNEVDKLWPAILKQLLGKSISKERDTILVCGHSLGAAMATIVASRIKNEGYKTVLYTYGSPRVGNFEWAEQFENIPTWRFVNNNDIVTGVPPFGLFTHVGELKYINYYGNVRKMSTWQRVKDKLRGRWRALQKFQLFDGLFDHDIGLYHKKVKKHEEVV